MKKYGTLQSFNNVPYEVMLDQIKRLNIDEIPIEHESKTLRYISETILDFKFYKYGEEGDVNFIFTKTIPVEASTTSIIKCCVDDCFFEAKYKIVEDFQGDNSEQKVLFTRTYHYCQSHKDLEDFCGTTDQSTEEI